ncbi:Gfo/Idh/MocA family oxidoreductase [Streptomyces sp. NBC_00053]|uniref:Gfo/Idh/MocA family protein n=1 Tax=unclassified Streptomyces TaxID=2593676 RepID=UPI000F5BEF5F|nr:MULTISPECIES: Gfo/Idh/MocA family oxidoreductase [unclassified Streptomyces]WSG49294.1 Gfo/Idh/MocA family oxidoreductase [Streptomyces sp. NBC_01732]WSW99947.1 Gfo/Idh/MocA family oxidoreductase [Streptomyces sp. NBC_00987]MCX4398274.1 Gfo/Idh/MocA family oxidoreductase [Streptomyces sp. NBC_01767]MCX5099020.1 Gfo/Idh/MocA family oxidoreductase [Streptomyces sp. NBC_00439]MCX5158556.1 Gfo/Idh/MocA family oxidoreductase [Streptomyces sp. NBC_00305]
MNDAAQHNDGTQGGDEGSMSRRSVLWTTAGVAGAGLGLGALGSSSAAAAPGRGPEGAADPAAAPKRQGRTMVGVPFDRRSTVRVGIVGLGNRGGSMIDLFLAVSGVQVVAVCDPVKAKAQQAAAKVTAAGQPAPAVYTNGEDDYENLCKRGDIDFVYVATPWDFHFQMAKTAMLNGKHVGVECPIALQLDQLWELVDLSERTRRHCMQLENCCYGQNEMRVLRMAHAGLFGDLLHGAGAYNHDLRGLMFDPDYYEGPWRRLWHTRLRGDLYPNHGFGPVANYMDINRGDRAVSITSVGSPSLGLAEYREKNMPAGDPSWKETYVESDRTISLVQTAKGRVIRLEHDVSTPHPYSRINSLGGTKGVFEDYPARIYIEPDHTNDSWGDFAKYQEWDHWLWKEHANPPGGHGGMDYMLVFRLMQCMRLGLVPDFDVYDAATWTSPVPLSHLSIKAKGAPQQIPDFTRGEWKKARSGMDSENPEKA